jgi:uncharacterized protein YecE (DUF72 family)
MATLKDPPNAGSEATTTAEPPELDLFAALEPEPLRPVGNPKILVGTASWTDPSLIKCGRFYPKGCNSAEDRLRHYASRFPLVEVNSSYYGLPSRSNSELWVERTPRDFTFNVKAFRLFTGHQTPLDVLPTHVRAALASHPKPNIFYKDVPREPLDEMWRVFIDAIEPLRDAGKLGALHFQFPPWVICGRKAREHLDEIRARLAEFTVSVEFRHQSWFTEQNCERTLEFEKERGFVNVVLDEPQDFTNSVGAHWVVTNPALAIVRLHGRNTATWNIQGATAASDRFNYDYSDLELEGLARSIRELSQKVDMTHVVFNNNYEDQGQRNATTLMEILDLARWPVLP